VRGDFSRTTFRPDKHYSGVLMQQGRVQVDADWNEEQAIRRHHAEVTAADLIGPTGAPQTVPGFGITATQAGDDLAIGAGHFYVDGVLCENDDTVAFTEQPDLRPTGGPLLPTADGLYVAYLEAWDRHVTGLEDESVKESALGGVDTATRTKTVWQVQLLPVADPGGSVTCDTDFPEWTELLAREGADPNGKGRMRAQSQLEEPSPDPLCVLPPSAGYRRLENQLYRVEVHQGGTRAEATFKWSRDNGTVASRIEPDEDGAVVSGTEIRVVEMGRDGVLTFASDPLPTWLELTDDRYELLDQRGHLAHVQSVDPATRTITFVADSLPPLDPDEHPVVRRWDQSGDDAAATGVPMTGEWQALEDGVEVLFEEGTYRTGDFWLVPARTAIGFETGTVEWPQEADGPAARLADGTVHHLARLALVRLSGGTFSLVESGDCRPSFPPLTAIAATDISFSDATCALGDARNVQEALDVLCQRSSSICTLLLGPGDDLNAALSQLGGAQDAMICLRAGTYTLSHPLRIEDRRHIQIVGTGRGTRVEAPHSEIAFRFERCVSATVENLSVAAGVVQEGGPAVDRVNGAITFVDCGSATVKSAEVGCAGGPHRAGSCITVRNAAAAQGTSATVDGCDVRVGHLQVGVLLINVNRSAVTGNVVGGAVRPPAAQLLADARYRGLQRRHLIANVKRGGEPPANTNATVTFNSQVVHLRTPPELIRGNRSTNDWQTAVTSLSPGGITSPRALERFLERLASDLLSQGGSGPGGSQAFRAVIKELLSQDTPTAEQAIVVGGEQAAEVRIVGNTLERALQGVHVGLGQEGVAIPAGVVVIEGNTIGVHLPTSGMRARHGISIAGANSVVIDGNFLSVSRSQKTQGLPVEGIRLFGTMGRRVVVRHNHLASGFPVGVTFAPLNAPLPAQPLWMITENVMELAAAKVDVPQKAPGRPGVGDANAVRAKVRGLIDNFA
jgi:Family of unknown function (DUF6519)